MATFSQSFETYSLLRPTYIPLKSIDMAISWDLQLIHQDDTPSNWVRQSHARYPLFNTILLPPNGCKSDARVPKALYGALTYTRLAINMLVYAWGSLVGKLSSEELEDVRRRIEDALKSIKVI